MVYLSITDVEHCLLSPCRVLEAHNYAHGSLFFVSEEGQESLQRSCLYLVPDSPKVWPFCFLGLTLELFHFPQKRLKSALPQSLSNPFPGSWHQSCTISFHVRTACGFRKGTRNYGDLQRTYRTTDTVFLDSGCYMIHSTLKDPLNV